MQPRIAVMIVTDHPIMRDGLRIRIQHETDMYVVCDASDLTQTLRDFGRCRPDVVVIDLLLPRGASLRAIKAIRKIAPGTPLVVLADDGAEVSVPSDTSEGATVVILRMLANEQVLPAIRKVIRDTRGDAGRA